MEARSLPPQRARGRSLRGIGRAGPLEAEFAALRRPGATWRRAATLAVLIGAPWLLIAGGVAAALALF